MPRGWEWDATLFKGSARYYERGRLPYPPGLADAIAGAASYYDQGREPYAPGRAKAFREACGLDGQGRLLDVGCGPGTVALRLAGLFETVV
ncbi:MAG: hypothetical protein ACTHMP_24995, partial [Thermomicrobiales bacterium]